VNIKNNILSIIRTSIFYSTLLTSGLLLTPFFLCAALLPTPWRYKNRYYFFLLHFWNHLIIKSAGISLSIHTKKNLTELFKKPAVIIANHPSTLDVSIIESILDSSPHMWIIKHEFKHLPIWGFILRKLHLLVARDNPKQAAISLANGIKKATAASAHLILFPEGTRTDNQKIYPFKKGFLTLANNLQRPIICIGIFGHQHVLAKKKILLPSFKTQIDLVIQADFSYNQYQSEEELIQAIEAWYQEQQTIYNRTRSSCL
jgi:1-acyl-sn-glycerol-3-phosphate acyltransferase